MSEQSRFILVSGLSGAGKTQALRFLEDLGYYCVDNLPSPLLTKFSELLIAAHKTKNHVAVCVDARSGEQLSQLPGCLDEVEELGFHPEVLFLETSDEVLIQRYSESRRRHPCAPEGSVVDGIRRERDLLTPVRARADLIVDTSSISISELRVRISSMFVDAKEPPSTVLTVMSFGFKYGLPQEADLVLDVRFLPNPFYDKALRPLTGNDSVIKDYVLNNESAQEFIGLQMDMLEFLVPRFELVPKSYLTIAVGCTGGMHRSVAVANLLAKLLKDSGYDSRLRHRELA